MGYLLGLKFRYFSGPCPDPRPGPLRSRPGPARTPPGPARTPPGPELFWRKKLQKVHFF